MMWKSKGVARWILSPVAAVMCLLCGTSRPAHAQEGPYQPWIGEKGITETVAQIMARDAITPRLPPGTIIEADERDEEAGEPERDNLPQDPNSPSVPFWPYIKGTDLSGQILPGHGHGDPFNPQTLGTEFNGPTLSLSGFIPPDTQGAVGPTQILMFANGRIQVYNKTGGLGSLNTTADVFFNSVRNGSSISDPQVKYDRTSGRWICLAVNTVSASNRIVLAVSGTSTITNSSSFTFYFFQQDTVAPTGNTGQFADYPKAGVDANAIYVGCNMFSSSFAGTTGWVIQKSSVLSGGPIAVTAFRSLATGSGAGPFSPMGVDNDDPSATEGYFVGVDNITAGRLVVRRITNPGGSPSISGNLNVTVPTTNNGQVQPALGSTGSLDQLDDRLFYTMMHKQRDTGASTLWCSHNIEVNASGTASTSGNRNGSRWYELQNLTTTPALRQSGVLFDPAATNPRGFWIPGIAMSGQGHMALGASYAGAADRAGCAVAGRLYGDALGTIQAVTLAEVSAASYNVQSGTQRWGDYANVWVDPNDDMTMWAFIEWCNGNNSWACRAIQLKAPPPATPASCSPASVAQGASNVNVVLTGTSVSGSGFFDPFAYYTNHIAAAFSGSGITINSITYNTPTQITLNISVSGAAATGGRTVTVTNPDGQAVASAGTVFTVDASGSQCPTITINPVSQTICSGSPVTFFIGASGNPTPTYQWRKNTVNIPGATSISYTIPATSPSDAGSYDCVATNSCGSATSTAATLTINVGASISGQPSGQTICSGSNASFTVTASGTPAPTYQWRKNGSNIGGATSATYSITGAVPGDAATYDCVVTNSCATVTSSGAILTVNTAASITGQPTNATACEGSAAGFTVTAGGSPAPSYQWRKNTVDIPGATNATLSFASVAAGDAGSYDCVVTNSCGSATSLAASLTVNTAASITGQPSGQTVCENDAASFTVTAGGSPAPTFQWRKNTVNIPGATSATLSLASATTGDAGSYDCVVTNSCGSVTSSAAVLAVNTAPQITGQPANATACEDSPASFSVSATGTPAPSYQWRHNTVNIPGATNALFSIPAVGTADAGSYDCVITNSCGSVTSTAATLTVDTAPLITGQPSGSTHCEGEGASFTVAATGSPAPTYQWQKNSVDIPGATSATYSIPSVLASDAGAYSCTVTNGCGSAISSSAALTVNTGAAFTTNPITQSICEGGTVVFSATATGSPAPTYQWTRDGIDLPGQTGTTLTLTGVTSADAAVYQCNATNACGTVGSATATLTVLTQVNITTNPAGQIVPEGGTATFTVAATGSGPLSYQWRKDGVNIPGATSDTLVIFPVTIDDAGDYDCVVSNTCGGQTSAPATLTVKCPADFDNSGFVDIEDYNAFVTAFEAGTDDADFDGSGFVDIEDFYAFVTAFQNGC